MALAAPGSDSDVDRSLLCVALWQRLRHGGPGSDGFGRLFQLLDRYHLAAPHAPAHFYEGAAPPPEVEEEAASAAFRPEPDREIRLGPERETLIPNNPMVAPLPSSTRSQLAVDDDSGTQTPHLLPPETLIQYNLAVALFRRSPEVVEMLRLALTAAEVYYVRARRAAGV